MKNYQLHLIVVNLYKKTVNLSIYSQSVLIGFRASCPPYRVLFKSAVQHNLNSRLPHCCYRRNSHDVDSDVTGNLHKPQRPSWSWAQLTQSCYAFLCSNLKDKMKISPLDRPYAFLRFTDSHASMPNVIQNFC